MRAGREGTLRGRLAPGQAQANGELALAGLATLVPAVHRAQQQLGVGARLRVGQLGGLAGGGGLLVQLAHQRVLGQVGRGFAGSRLRADGPCAAGGRDGGEHRALRRCLLGRRGNQGGQRPWSSTAQHPLQELPRLHALPFGVGLSRLGQRQRAIGLVRIGSGEVTGAHTAVHVVAQGLGVLDLGAGQRQLGARALPRPPGLAHLASELKPGAGEPGVKGLLFLCGQGLAARALAGQPQGQGHAHLQLLRTPVGARSVGLCAQLQRAGLSRPGFGGLTGCRQCAAPRGQCLRQGVRGPGLFKGLGQGFGGLCGGVLRRDRQGQGEGEASGQVQGWAPQGVRVSVHAMRLRG